MTGLHLKVPYDCASPHPRIMRVRDPFAWLLVRTKGAVGSAVFAAAEGE